MRSCRDPPWGPCRLRPRRSPSPMARRALRRALTRSRASPRLPSRARYDLSTDCWLGGADDMADQVPYRACGRSAPADPDGLKLAVQVQFGDSYGAEPTDGQVVGHC